MLEPKHTFVCSPFRDPDPEKQRENVRITKAICRKIALRGDIPFAPHLHYPQFLFEETERRIGMKCGLSFLECWAENLAAWPPVITSGMEDEVKKAYDEKIVRVKTLPLDFLNDAGSQAYLRRLEEEDLLDIHIHRSYRFDENNFKRDIERDFFA